MVMEKSTTGMRENVVVVVVVGESQEGQAHG